MPEPDTDWLLENDPEASGKSRREYARQTGILNGSIDRDIHHMEAQWGAEGRVAKFHCSACWRKEFTNRHTVE